MIRVGLVIFQMSFQYSLFSHVLNGPFLYVHKIQSRQSFFFFFLYLHLWVFIAWYAFSVLYKLKQKLMKLEILSVISAVCSPLASSYVVMSI